MNLKKGIFSPGIIFTLEEICWKMERHWLDSGTGKRMIVEKLWTPVCKISRNLKFVQKHVCLIKYRTDSNSFITWNLVNAA